MKFIRRTTTQIHWVVQYSNNIQHYPDVVLLKTTISKILLRTTINIHGLEKKMTSML